MSAVHAAPLADVPPQNLEAEEAVLGAMLLSETAIGAVTEILDAADFYRGSHGTIYRTCLALWAKGEPVDAITLANELEERIIPLHDASNIAALIVDPVAASGGVLVPPKGYLQRLREICTRHGILLIFDEVITGWGRLGAPFAAQHFGIEHEFIDVDNPA